jgi:hypothetical protein
LSLLSTKRGLPAFIITLLLIFFQSSLISYGQKKTEGYIYNHFFAEVAGIGGRFSVNYERKFLHTKNLRFFARLGLGSIHLKDFNNKLNPDLVIPLALVATYGKKHHLEWGFGQTFTNIVTTDFDDGTKGRQSSLSSHFLLGYRFQKKGRGLVYRLTYTPLIEYNKYFRHWGGFSIGYAF